MNETVSAARPDEASARIAFVGTGPGAPGLLTLRGAELLEQADVVLHDAGTAIDSVSRHLGADVLDGPFAVSAAVRVCESRSPIRVRLVPGEDQNRIACIHRAADFPLDATLGHEGHRRPKCGLPF